jgi:hypothetical protein
MSDTARDYQPVDAATTDGMDELFNAEDSIGQVISLAQDRTPQDTTDKLWTVLEAARHFNVSEKTILRRLQKGSIKGHKVPGQFGLEWRIARTAKTETGDKKGALDRAPQDILEAWDSSGQDIEVVEDRTPQDTIEAWDSPGQDRLIDEQKQEIEALRAKLEGAIYRNGYLESKLEEREKQILLLTDSQHKPGWWAKFSSWFFKGQ